jgi:MarR family transcriptional regulator, organic hydroperoxide resistance regulator
MIQREIKQSRPFTSRRQEALLALLRTAHMLRRAIDAVVQREGLTAPQYNVLRILRGAREPLPTMEVAERMIEPTPGITRLVSSLEARGLLSREPWGSDRRCILCQITRAGLTALERLDEAVEELDRSWTRSLDEQQVATLVESLDSIRTHDLVPERAQR